MKLISVLPILLYDTVRLITGGCNASQQNVFSKYSSTASDSYVYPNYWEYYAHKTMNYAMLLCSNVVVIMLFLPNYASFLNQNCFSNSPKDMYCKCQNMNNPKHWYSPYLLQINIGYTSWWTRCHWHIWYMWYTRAVRAWYATWPYSFFGNILYYASIMTRFKRCQLCS